MPPPTDLRKQFIKVFDRLAPHREHPGVLADFLEMAVVKRNRPEDVRAMPELLAITTLAIQEGGSDFLCEVVGALELRSDYVG